MNRIVQFVVVSVLLAVTASAQRAQLPRKGRELQRGPVAAPAAPLRRLPRDRGVNPLRPFLGSSLDEQIEIMRTRPKPRYMSLDSLRELMRSTADRPSANDVPVMTASQPMRPLPRFGLDMSLLVRRPTFHLPNEQERSTLEMAVESRWNGAVLASNGGDFPDWRRYDDASIDVVQHPSKTVDPYNRNVLKGDYPIFGRKVFMNFSAASNSLVETRRIPAVSPPSGAEPGTSGFFGNGEALAMNESFRPSLSIFHGAAGFKPVDWGLRVTPEIDANYLLARENSITNIDVRTGIRRTDTRVGWQELYFEKRLDFLTDPQYDFSSLRVGVQRFTSDFRGFVFSDEEPGARLFGTLRNNTLQYNLAFFKMLEKDSNSGLNTWSDRHQNVYAANMYWFDAFTRGYNLNFSALYNNDQPSFLVDKDGFLVRPAAVGTPLPHKVRAAYAGVSGDGHIGRINVSNAFYQAFGRDDFNPIAGRAQHINAQLAALELAYESNWKTFRASMFFTSGDGNLQDGQARGFDAIVPNQQFAGGGFLSNPALADRGLLNNAFEGGGTNFLNREAFPLTGTNVLLFGPNSLIPSLRSSAFQGQANFVNPGLLLYNLGFDAKLTPKWRTTLNVNYLQFHRTEILEAILFQSNIPHAIGFDTGTGVQYRPKLNDNIVLTGGFGVLFPQHAFRSIYSVGTLYSGFLLARFQF